MNPSLMPTQFDAHHQGCLWQRVWADTPKHVEQERLGVDVLFARTPREPGLAPGAERSHKLGQFFTRFRQRILGPAWTIKPLDRADQKQFLQPLGQHRLGDARDPAPNVIEPPASA
jgi:hypothetical protein